jgi:hypothetical protein
MVSRSTYIRSPAAGRGNVLHADWVATVRRPCFLMVSPCWLAGCPARSALFDVVSQGP